MYLFVNFCIAKNLNNENIVFFCINKMFKFMRLKADEISFVQTNISESYVSFSDFGPKVNN